MRLPYFIPLGVLALLPCLAPLHAQPKVAGQVSVGAYNVENWFDVFDNPYSSDEDMEPKTRADIQTLARAIKKLDADVVVFQELENEHVLHAMVDEFLPDMGYKHITAAATNSERGINLGVISRLPILRVASYRFQTLTHPDAPGRTWLFARGPMQVTLDAGPGQPLEVFSIHLKSNRDSPGDKYSLLYRTAEAFAFKDIVRAMHARNPGVLYVAAGDFNSQFETRPEQDRPWPAMAHLLAADSDGLRLFTDCHAALPDEQRITIPGSGRYPPATFDYVLASPAMAKRYIEGSATVVRDPDLTAASDHRPLKAAFKLD